jgi:hypothetical protein
VPFIILAAGTLLIDGIFDSDSHQTVWLTPFLCIDPVPFTRALPVVFLFLVNPQPFAGIAYILHHSPVTYAQSKKLLNPEMQPLSTDLKPLITAIIQNGPRLQNYWPLVYVLLCVVAPFMWLCTSRERRHPGLKHPVSVITAYVLLVLLSIDRARNLVWSSCFIAAMLCVSAESGDNTKASTASGHRSARLLHAVLAVGLLILDWRTPTIKATTHTWPVGSAEFVRTHRPKGNVYHTITFGGYLVHGLREYRNFADTREYCFTHLDDVSHVYFFVSDKPV